MISTAPALLPQKILTGQKALVTGANSGIGRGVAVALGQAGADVVVNYVTGEDAAEAVVDEIRRSGVQAFAHQADVSSESQVSDMFARMCSQFGTIDILIANAGLQRDAAFHAMTLEQWNTVLGVNLTGQFLCAHHAVPMLKAAGGGAMINLSSAAGRFGYAWRTPYSAAKWGVIGFTESLAKELGPSNIRVNAILPGVVAGPRIEGVIGARARQEGVSYAAMEQTYLARVSMRRMVTAQDVAGSVLYLLSAAGVNISGLSLNVDANVESL